MFLIPLGVARLKHYVCSLGLLVFGRSVRVTKRISAKIMVQFLAKIEQ